MLVEQHCQQQHHLMAVQGVDESSLQQVQDLDRAVAGAADQEVVGRVDGEAVDGGAVNCTTPQVKRRHAVNNEDGSSGCASKPL